MKCTHLVFGDLYSYRVFLKKGNYLVCYFLHAANEENGGRANNNLHQNNAEQRKTQPLNIKKMYLQKYILKNTQIGVLF